MSQNTILNPEIINNPDDSISTITQPEVINNPDLLEPDAQDIEDAN
ncbi:hypothetical protein ACFQ2T_08175 [Methylophilus flavus]|uniref:Uncharacterized protein n=1 Tax=Methylophilus flavus TaxID=640084 RepID=A0ABW3P921_9PROT